MAKKSPSKNMPTIPTQYFSEQDAATFEHAFELAIKHADSSLMLSRSIHELIGKIAGVQKLLDDIRLAPQRDKVESAAKREALKVNQAEIDRATTVGKRKIPHVH